jgi:1,2-diacylglycerol 3-beta-glucosyltransferase
MVLIRAMLELSLVVGLLGLSALVCYLWFLALAFFAGKRAAKVGPVAPGTRFAFVVPAHDEESGITATIQSLLAVDYPGLLFDVVVIADNCSDATGARAREAGALCLERRDTSLRGKGYALRHAFSELLPLGYDAFIVIDADSIVSANFLTGLSARLACGEQVVQAYDGMSNPDASIMTYLFQVGNLIENKLYWEPKQNLGMPIFLRGNGMCFTREILERYPWDAFSITEDTEYGLMLVGQGVRVNFAPEIAVYACQPETLQQAFVQRVRWAAGNSTLTKGRALKLIASGLLRRDLSSLDLGVSLIAGSRPLLLVANLALVALSAALRSPGLLACSGILLLAQLLYLGMGILLNGLSGQKLLRLVLSPFYLTWLCTVSLLGTVGFRKNQWTRTTRS